eukprot:806411_1
MSTSNTESQEAVQPYPKGSCPNAIILNVSTTKKSTSYGQTTTKSTTPKYHKLNSQPLSISFSTSKPKGQTYRGISDSNSSSSVSIHTTNSIYQ